MGTHRNVHWNTIDLNSIVLFWIKKGKPLSKVFKLLYIEEPKEVPMDETVMSEIQKETLYITFKAVNDSISKDKKLNPKNEKMIKKFKGRINIGLHVERYYILWLNLQAQNSRFELNRGKFKEYDLEIISDPEDLMFFSNGENSVMHMMLKKNRFGYRKLRFKGGTTGLNLLLLLKLPKVLVLNKEKKKDNQ